MELRELTVGCYVVFIDEHYHAHDALITAIHGDPLGRVGNWNFDEAEKEMRFTPMPGQEDKHDWPCLNLLFVCHEPEKKDQYGRQIDRRSSIVHVSHSSAGASCWQWADETSHVNVKTHT